jgi:hypothetical protein
VGRKEITMNKELKTICCLGIVVLGIAVSIRINILFVSEVGRIVPLVVQNAALMLFGAFVLSILNAANSRDAGAESEKFIPIIFLFCIGATAIGPLVGLGSFIGNYSFIAFAALIVLGGVILAMFRWVNKQ